MFAYCNNNPVMRIDISGTRSSFLCFQVLDDDRGGGNHSRTNKESPYTTVNNKKSSVYIVADGDGEELAEKYKDDRTVVIIEDKRTSGDADIKVYYSAYITDIEIQTEIVQVIIDYDALYPSVNSWSREADEMLYEWAYHNFFANANIMFDRFGHVDFNEKDKNKTVFAKGVEFVWEYLQS